VYIAGGGASAGTGFYEAWNLIIEGNNGSYTGNGPVIAAHCVFPDPQPVDPDQYLSTSPPCTIPGTPDQTGTITSSITGANLGMDE
jgi:hypothetical protein